MNIRRRIDNRTCDWTQILRRVSWISRIARAMSIANGLRRRTCNSCLRPFVNRPPRAATATVCRVQPCKQAEPASPFTTGYYSGDGAHVHARHVGCWDAGCNFVETAASPECHLPGSIASVTLAPGSQYHLVSGIQFKRHKGYWLSKRGIKELEFTTISWRGQVLELN